MRVRSFMTDGMTSRPQHHNNNLSAQAGSIHQGTQETLPRRSDMTSGGSSAHAHWAAAVTRATLDVGHVRYHTKGFPSTQGSCNPHHAPGRGLRIMNAY